MRQIQRFIIPDYDLNTVLQAGPAPTVVEAVWELLDACITVIEIILRPNTQTEPCVLRRRRVRHPQRWRRCGSCWTPASRGLDWTAVRRAPPAGDAPPKSSPTGGLPPAGGSSAKHSRC